MEVKVIGYGPTNYGPLRASVDATRFSYAMCVGLSWHANLADPNHNMAKVPMYHRWTRGDS